ncbi:hypothetical protein K438DRAFT_1802810 [Mycena galopus ATCC 62051]|nr:hypothetical protein K438DRAFT_1802810 [Mycena galopus ATCC 62051]
MAATSFSIRTLLFEQTQEKARGSSTIQIKQLIEESDSKITSLENEIAALESQLAALAELRDRESATASILRSLIAPIRALPVELLAEIFLLTIRDTNYPNLDYFHIQDAFRVSHVCRHWRKVADSTPRLWTGPMLVSFFREPGSNAEEVYANGLQTWLARSAPLSVPISITNLDRHAISSRLTEEVLQVAFRWRSLRVIGTAPSSQVRRLSEGWLDALEELELGKIVRDGYDPSAIVLFTTAPRLRKLTMDLGCQIPMPFLQLTDLTLNQLSEDPSAELLLDILAQCTNLSGARVFVTGWSAGLPTTRVNIIALNRLRNLSLAFVRAGDISLLDHLSAPALDDVHLYFQSSPTQWLEATFTTFQLRSPHITKLEISARELYLPPHALRATLFHAPCLTHLSVDECDSIDDALLHALCYTEDAQPLVPRLHSLTLSNMSRSGNGMSENLFASMIASRWWTDAELVSRSRPPTVARWRQIRVSESPYSEVNLTSQFWDTMEDLQQTGLDIVIELGVDL